MDCKKGSKYAAKDHHEDHKMVSAMSSNTSVPSLSSAEVASSSADGKKFGFSNPARATVTRGSKFEFLKPAQATVKSVSKVSVAVPLEAVSDTNYELDYEPDSWANSDSSPELAANNLSAFHCSTKGEEIPSRRIIPTPIDEGITHIPPPTQSLEELGFKEIEFPPLQRKQMANAVPTHSKPSVSCTLGGNDNVKSISATSSAQINERSYINAAKNRSIANGLPFQQVHTSTDRICIDEEDMDDNRRKFCLIGYFTKGSQVNKSFLIFVKIGLHILILSTNLGGLLFNLFVRMM